VHSGVAFEACFPTPFVRSTHRSPGALDQGRLIRQARLRACATEEVVNFLVPPLRPLCHRLPMWVIFGPRCGQWMRSALVLILLQKSKVASVRIFGETLKREAIDDSDNLSRVTEVAYEFGVRR
jgi:hypothetical protein